MLLRDRADHCQTAPAWNLHAVLSEHTPMTSPASPAWRTRERKQHMSLAIDIGRAEAVLLRDGGTAP